MAACGVTTYINNAAERSNGVWSVDGITAPTSVLHDCASNHDDVLGGAGQLLDDQEDHLSEAGILVLEELRDSEEERGGLVGGELVPRVEDQGDLGQEYATSSGLDRGAVEESCWGSPELDRETETEIPRETE